MELLVNEFPAVRPVDFRFWIGRVLSDWLQYGSYGVTMGAFPDRLPQELQRSLAPGKWFFLRLRADSPSLLVRFREIGEVAFGKDDELILTAFGGVLAQGFEHGGAVLIDTAKMRISDRDDTNAHQFDLLFPTLNQTAPEDW
jgi:hypothetical protein